MNINPITLKIKSHFLYKHVALDSLYTHMQDTSLPPGLIAPSFDKLCLGFFANQKIPPPFATSQKYRNDPRFCKIEPQGGSTMPLAPRKPVAYMSRTALPQSPYPVPEPGLGEFRSNTNAVSRSLLLPAHYDDTVSPSWSAQRAADLELEHQKLMDLYTRGVSSGTVAATTQPSHRFGSPPKFTCSTSPYAEVGHKRRDLCPPSLPNRQVQARVDSSDCVPNHFYHDLLPVYRKLSEFET